MKVWMTTVLSLVIFLAVSAIHGQPAPAHAEEMAPAPAAPTTAPIENTLMPIGTIGSGMPLEDVLHVISDQVPGFNSVIQREGQTDSGYPTLPAMRLKNVSIGQFLKFIQMSYPARVERIDGPAGPLYLIQVSQPTTPQTAQIGMPPPGFPGGPPPANEVKVYRLTAIIDSLTNGDNSADAQKKAMNNVLSLIQAALDQANGKGETVLKVHDPTQTLVFKGSLEKMTVLEQVLQTLEPKTPDLASQFQALKKSASDNEQAYRSAVDTLHTELQKKTVEAKELSEQNTILQTRLKQLEDQLNQREAKPDNKPTE